MSHVVRRRWDANVAGIDLPRRDRQSCTYEAYVPDTLAGRTFVFEGPVTADVSDAEHAIVALNARASTLVDTEALARLLLRAESVASSRIEGLEIGTRRLLRADAVRQLGEGADDLGAAEVLANIDAMAFAAEAVRISDPISVDTVLEVHRRLLAPTALSAYGGRVRTEQNWIGGNRYNPCSADFVPPPPDDVPRLLNDLIAFCNEDALPAVIQAALAHAQFETIHPFVDGNGRVGRTLIHMVLRRRRLAPRVLPPVSLVLATWSDRYVAGLTATRYRGEPGSPLSREGINHWVALFATACRRAVHDANAFEERVQAIQQDWRKRVGPVRSDSTTALLLKKLPGAPIITVQSAAELTSRSVQAANEAVSRLAAAGIVHQSKVGRRNRAFEAREIIDAFTDLERRLASATGDTRVAPPERPVPRRKAKKAPPRPRGDR
ncbi:MAG: filamentation induced by cAMP protein Fic [Candidatus Eremiobacteraeota bacterium]|nr:filamentation induced by cAMP protein Fic [Candidatus Eremiobacteraeota bacterium]